MTADRRRLPPSPIKRLATRTVGVGALFGVLGIVELLQRGTMPIASPLLLCGAWYVLHGLRLRGEGEVAQQLNAALDRLTRGHVDEAERILDAIPARGLKRQLRRASEIQRAMIALRRDDPTSAVEHATRATGGRYALWSRSQELVQEASAFGIRAVANAGRGDAAAALEDVARVRSLPSAGADTLARAALAEAIVLSRSDKREELAAHLARHRKALFEFTAPRDRALVRALQRSLYLRPGSAYREPARRDEPRSERPLAGWMAKVAPATKGVAMSGGAMAAQAEQVGVGAPLPSARTVAVEMKRRARLEPKAVALAFVVLLVGGVIAFELIESTQATHASRVDPIAAFGVAIVPILAAAVAVAQVRGNLLTRRLLAATRLLAQDDLAPAVKAFTALATNTAPLVAAQAKGALARLEAQKGDFQAALALCDQAIARVARSAIAAQLLLPAIQTERAYCLAATKRFEESTAELAALVAAHPAYPHLASSQLRVRLMQAIRADDVLSARAIAAQRTPDMPLAYQDELVADIACVAGDERPASEEVQRLREELSTDPALREWVAAVWPGGERALDEAAARTMGGARARVPRRDEPAEEHEDATGAEARRAVT